MIKERVITVIRESGLKNPELEERTGVNRYTWQNIRNKPERALKTEEIEAVIELFPQYGYWIATGNVAPEIGQTSPEYDQVNSKLDKRAEG
jgi:hypothetical protein